MHGWKVVGLIFALILPAILWWWLGADTQAHQQTAAHATPANVRSTSSITPSDDARITQPRAFDRPPRKIPTGNPEKVSTAEPADPLPSRSVADNAPHIDPGRAADLFAERLGKLEDIDAIDNGSDLRAAREYRKFKSLSANDARANEITQALRNYVDDWVAQLPHDQQVALVNIECRTSLCQILLAQHATNLSADSTQARRVSQAAFEQLFFASPREPSWSQLHLAFVSLQSVRQSDYMLDTVYLQVNDNF